MSQSPITTHILDTSRGRPAAGVHVTLEYLTEHGKASVLGHGLTDADGRLRTLLSGDERPQVGTYRLTFDTGAYFSALGVEAFYPSVSIVFLLRAPEEHHHVPLLLNPFGYSTYRGS
ncbi:hydroxyisourate hydrolase [Chondromyces apiculatus]|uniref:5-hydroxyisourate hydrolase n=1 Tax=Chondromyces apiculatus DSM 436 TaxID=1192034 RepID=A0A017T9R2_9BACT|nr:hydroxyisourate hydrolase [Chondromyces apiculatus]EYF05667.1 5-Hydroxyisourate Hydrolase (HIUase) [Chondromyces apiculatus DSM 436]